MLSDVTPMVTSPIVCTVDCMMVLIWEEVMWTILFLLGCRNVLICDFSKEFLYERTLCIVFSQDWPGIGLNLDWCIQPRALLLTMNARMWR